MAIINDQTDGTIDQVIQDQSGVDVLIGSSGDDTFELLDANDFGNNGIFYSSDPLPLQGNGGMDIVDASGAGVGITIADLIFLGAFEDNEKVDFIGSDFDDSVNAMRVDFDVSLLGNGGDDRLRGGAGDDVLDGGLGDDTLNGGGGSNILIGGPGNDQIQNFSDGDEVIDAGDGDDVLRLFGNRGVGSEDDPFNMAAANAEWFITGGGTSFITAADDDTGVTVTSYGTTTAWGSDHQDELKAIRGGAVEFYGNNGNDRLVGAGDDDVLDGGKGNDTLRGRGGDDELSGKAGDDTLEGGAGKDTLNGGGGDDELDGGDGDDVLDGDRGVDSLTGGSGADTFRFDNRDAGVKTITDFEAGVDEAFFRIDGGYFADSPDIKRNNNQATVSSEEDLQDLIAAVHADDGTNNSVSAVDGDLVLVIDADNHFRGDLTIIFEGFGDVLMEDTIMDEELITIEGNINNGNRSTETVTITMNFDFEEGSDNTVAKADAVSLHLGANRFIGREIGTATIIDDAGIESDFDTSSRGEYRELVGGFLNINHRDNDVDDLLDNLLKSDGIAGLEATINDDDTIQIAITGRGDVVDFLNLEGVFIEQYIASIDDPTEPPSSGPGGAGGAGGAPEDVVSATINPIDIDASSLSANGTSFEAFGVDGADFVIANFSSPVSVEAPETAGGDGPDTIDGAAADDIISTFAGDDTVMSGAGNDIVLGGVGDDTLEGGAGTDGLDGGSGDDFVRGQAGNDVLFGDPSPDEFGTEPADAVDDPESAGGDDVILGGTGDDLIFAGGGNDQVEGGSDDDVILGGSGDDELIGDTQEEEFGGTGDTVLDEDAGADVIEGGAGNDIIAGGFNPTGRDFLFGGEGDDTIRGDVNDSKGFAVGHDDFMDGGAGDDAMGGKGGNDEMFGGAGNDTMFGDAGSDFLDGGAGNDRLVGDTEENGQTPVGLGVDDLLIGGAGDDYIDGGLGNDLILTDGIDGERDPSGDTDTVLYSKGDGEDVIADFDLDGGGEDSFDTLKIEGFDAEGLDGTINTVDSLFDYIELIETDGNPTTDALIADTDLILDFGDLGGSIRLAGILDEEVPSNDITAVDLAGEDPGAADDFLEDELFAGGTPSGAAIEAEFPTIDTLIAASDFDLM